MHLSKENHDFLHNCKTSLSKENVGVGIFFISDYLQFCTPFAISSPRVCPEIGSNPSSSSFGPWDDIYLTKSVTCAVYFMSQD
ncbi:unnamed protein product [Larinioides sclopetarius]|uniref:Uncharacterized protein n=1 Tax=Larinioides sclopetarius TaxID=280406 RepID=A0AAV1ZNI1_9ARAC